MKCVKIWRVCGAVLWLVQLAAEVLAAAAVWRLNMLPGGYFALLVGALAVLWLIPGLLLFLPVRKRRGGAFASDRDKPRGVFRRMVGAILALAVAVGSVFAWDVVSNVHSTVDGITGAANVVNVSMAVYVLDEDPASTLADTAGYTFSYLEGYEISRTAHVVSEIREAQGDNFEILELGTLSELVDALYRGDADALILNSAYLTILEETEEYADFSQRTRLIHTARIEETIPETEPVTEPTTAEDQTAPTEPPFSITTHPFIMYISGSDTRDYYLSTSRSDVNILMVVNPQSKQVLLLNTPRDYFVSNPAGNGAKDKLTHCGIYGTSCSVGALEGLYDVSVRYYSQINFTGVETLIDAIGGVDVYSDVAFTAVWTYPIAQGWNHLNGAEARGFAQDRYSHAGGDNVRGQNQMKVIQAVIKKITSGTTIIENYAGILESIEGMFKTNVSTEEIGELVKMQLSDMASWNIMTYAVTGEGGSDITYSMPGLYCYVMYPDEEMVSYGSELIRRVFDGEILTDEDMICP